MPRPPGGMGRGLFLALLVHGLLIAGLAIGVNWRSSSSTPLQAELWAAVPQVAAPRAATADPTPTAPAREPPPPRPRPPEPAPAPPPPKAQPDAQIKLEEARKEKQREDEAREQARRERDAARKLEQAKAEQAEKAAKAEQAKKAEAALAEKKREEQEKAEAARQADARAAAVKRMLEQAGGSSGEVGSKGSAAQSAAPSAGYPGRVVARVKPNIVFVDDLATNPEAEVLLRLAPDGRIISQKLVRSSGVKEWDLAVQRAIERTEMLPRDVDGRVPSSMVIVFRPRE